MGYQLNGGMIGVIIILVLSIAITPILCNIYKESYSEVSCTLADQSNTFSKIYFQLPFILLLIMGFIGGMFAGRLVYQTRIKLDTKFKALQDKMAGKPEFKWMWEY